nr:phosphatidylinositol mannoside acyltransferase [Arsenicicoccus piscis]
MVRLLPPRLAYGLFDLVADRTVAAGSKDSRQLRANYARLHPQLPEAELDALVRAGLRSYLRYWCDAFRLPDLRPEQIRDSVLPLGDAGPRAALAQGRGVVMFLGHLGSWDLAGAWSTLELAPVTTVAERLRPEELYDAFVGFREALGMRILPLTGGEPPFAELVRVLSDGGFVPLLADRDLTSSGVTVTLAGQQAQVAAGPAALALASGAALYPVSITYRPRLAPGGTGSGYDLVVEWHDEVVPADGDGVADLTQRCVDALAPTLLGRTEEWHMMQRVFVDPS